MTALGRCDSCTVRGADHLCRLDGEDAALCQDCIDARWCEHCDDWADKCGHTPSPYAIAFGEDERGAA